MIEQNNIENSAAGQGDEGEASLLDMLVLVAQNLKLLILGPLAAGLLALGVCYLVPQSYTSEAIVALPFTAPAGAAAQAAAVMTSPLVLDPVIVSLNLAQGESVQAARKKLVGQVKAITGKDGLLRLETTANSPLEAQQIGGAVLENWLKSTIPGAEDRLDMEARLAVAKVSLESVERLLKRLTSEGLAALAQPLTRGEAGTPIVAVGDLQARFLNDVLTIPRTLKGYSRDIVKQVPTLPTETVAPKKAMIAVVTTLGSGFLLLLLLLFRKAWQDSAKNSVIAEKQARLLSAIGGKV
jgi:hypothetical protein